MASFCDCEPAPGSNIFDPTCLVASRAQLKKLGEGFGFTEGPAVDKFGNVFFTDQPNNKIHKWATNNGAITTFLSNSGRSNGMYFDKKGFLITCADMHGEIWSIDKGGNHTVLVNNYNGKLLNGPNDLWINPANGGCMLLTRYSQEIIGMMKILAKDLGQEIHNKAEGMYII